MTFNLDQFGNGQDDDDYSDSLVYTRCPVCGLVCGVDDNGFITKHALTYTGADFKLKEYSLINCDGSGLIPVDEALPLELFDQQIIPEPPKANITKIWGY